MQDSRDAQSYNRYSYVQNNPVTHADPSGYFTVKQGLVVAVVVVVVGVLTGGAAAGAWGTAAGSFLGTTAAVGGGIVGGAVGGFSASFTGSLLNGGSLGDAFKAGLLGGIAGAVAGGIISHVGDLASAGKLSLFQKAIGHGFANGLGSEIEGGKFQHGFVAGFATGAASRQIDKLGAGERWGRAARAAVAAIVGGTASVLGGGKFANGAISGAFTRMFNDDAAHAGSPKEVQDHLDLLKAEADGGNEFAQEAYELLTKDGVTITFEDSVYLEGKPVHGATISTGSHNQFDSAEIRIQRGLSTDETLAVLVHESAHVLDSTLSFLLQGRQSVEIRAHTFEEQYRIRKGLPAGVRGFQKGPKSNRQVNTQAIEKWVEKQWPASDGGLSNF